MNVDKIGRVGGYGYEPKKTASTSKTESNGPVDTISISDAAKKLATEAKLQSEVKQIAKQIVSAPPEEDRTEKIKAVKDRLKNGDYDNLSNNMLDKISDQIASTFLGQL
ncbi:flagellar biosynthesis anti-sigma factor FlgM [Leptospira ilyithenensis]|uniref:Flagellar biosynthesis anti-sigma factor FlgM n=1 Tax=Leptospira ilyithenensis TaxID=2484901 RepID=A0A4R9LT39_9LEPT|nr:flagellar biosynthesis anti-sigma factor FlgM [Leptospira ilyithenensis]TGN11906.1 flagellar biosynthesis anti-sigma factor FlgM [Leptospira ilyithenensis]